MSVSVIAFFLAYSVPKSVIEKTSQIAVFCFGPVFLFSYSCLLLLATTSVGSQLPCGASFLPPVLIPCSSSLVKPFHIQQRVKRKLSSHPSHLFPSPLAISVSTQLSDWLIPLKHRLA